MPSPKKSNAPTKQTQQSTLSAPRPSSTEHPSFFLTSFSPDCNLFALVILAVDKHRLRVYNAATGVAVSEYIIDAGHVTALKWGNLPSQVDPNDSTSRKRKKIGIKNLSEDDEVIVLGLSDGSVFFFSPSHSKVLNKIVPTITTAAVLALAIDPTNRTYLWISSSDGSIRLWDIQKSTLLKTWGELDCSPCTSLSMRPSPDDSQKDLLVARNRIHLLTDIYASPNAAHQDVTTFTGHASLVNSLLWKSEDQFFSSAEGDRFINLWEISSNTPSEMPLASIPFDSPVRSMVVAQLNRSKSTLIALSASGKVSFVPIPTEFRSSADRIVTILPRSTLSSEDPPIVSFTPLPGILGVIRVVRLMMGIRPHFETIRYMGEDGKYIQQLLLNDITKFPINEMSKLTPLKRYQEPTSMEVLEPAAALNGAVSEHIQLEPSLQVDTAELSLGQKLALTMNTDSLTDSGDDDENLVSREESTQKQIRRVILPSNSLGRTLIQALHSSDTHLLETCLAHTDESLILNSVRRLPPQLSIPLIAACLERLGRGSRGSSLKGGGASASSQRGAGLLIWIKIVLSVHAGHLMTIPDLVARLSGLHSILTARIRLHENLLSLGGRLDMVLAQAEIRAATIPSTTIPVNIGRKKKDRNIKRYREEEHDSVEEMGKEYKVVSDEDSVEDIELGGYSDNDEDERPHINKTEFKHLIGEETGSFSAESDESEIE